MICLDGEKCFAQSFCVGGGKWSTGGLGLACCKVISMSSEKANCIKFILSVPTLMSIRWGRLKGTRARLVGAMGGWFLLGSVLSQLEEEYFHRVLLALHY